VWSQDPGIPPQFFRIRDHGTGEWAELIVTLAGHGRVASWIEPPGKRSCWQEAYWWYKGWPGHPSFLIACPHSSCSFFLIVSRGLPGLISGQLGTRTEQGEGWRKGFPPVHRPNASLTCVHFTLTSIHHDPSLSPSSGFFISNKQYMSSASCVSVWLNLYTFNIPIPLKLESRR
jgi:hypothetical protein